MTLTFVKDFATHASPTAKDILVASWGLYIVSILCGFLTLMASAGVQQEAADMGAIPAPQRTDKQEAKVAPSINARNLRQVGAAQLLTFLVAIILTVIAGAIAV